MKRLISLAALAMLLPVAAIRADLPPLPPRAGDPVPLVIVVDEKAAPAKLTIPKGLVATMKASLENGGDASYATISTSTIAAGLSLSLALAFGGVWLVRHRTSPGMKNFAILLGAVSLLGVGAFTVFADRPPVGKRPALAPGEAVIVTVVDDADARTVTLTVSKDKLAKALEKAAK
jgi:hypothetical protein